MKQKPGRIIRLTGILLLSAAPLVVHGEVIKSFDISSVFSTGAGPGDHVEVKLWYTEHLGGSDPLSGNIFDSLELEASDVGSIFTVDSSNDPDFSTIASLLTDGIDNYLNWSIGTVNVGGDENSLEEAANFGTTSFSTNNIDFQGCVINSITFEFTEYSIENQGPLSYYEHSGTVRIMGTAIPEPNSIVMILFGVFIIWKARKIINPTSDFSLSLRSG